MLITFDSVKRSVYWFDQCIFDVRSDNSYQYILDYITVLGASILNTRYVFGDCSPSSASRTAKLPSWRRVTRVEAQLRARGRRDPEAEAIGHGQNTVLKKLLAIKFGRLRNSQIRQ